jgi:hypothetical protein
MSAMQVKQSVAYRLCRAYKSCFDKSTYETQFAVPRSHLVFQRKNRYGTGMTSSLACICCELVLLNHLHKPRG